ncbi:uncharacterized protein LOC109536882 [Dendroctonus ponderosae]|uniref:uncharacterized protein LOC109536882 n=1 Tax=Dendroctonus ponderosae TaxID=77166 RepID=UPI002035A2B6|nr:uncharacterized protein LOC109536882 [Dendroctonus ponderosae]XP_048523284.1 uncharacterized protein LOC109536882 [Dendroctonus ponderosae]KAH1015317.1 hypothetical protein HUJ05_013069 [Dendroctonus ponderosae]
MRKSTSASSFDHQKDNFVPCRCPGNPKLALGSARPPLATIQEEAPQKQNLTTNYHKKINQEMEEKSKRATISPILPARRTHVLSKAPEMASSSRRKESHKETQRPVSQPIFIPWAESTSVTQKVQSSISRIHPVIHSVALSVSSGSKFSTADTVLQENKENRSQAGFPKRPDRHLMDSKEPSCRRGCDQRASISSISQVEAPRSSALKTSTIDMRGGAKEKQRTFERSQLKTSQTTVSKLKPPVRADLSASTTSSSSSGYISMKSTKSSSTLKPDGKVLQVAELDSQKFKTLTQKTISFSCPSYSCSSKIPTKSSECLTVCETQKSKSPWEAVSLAAQMGKVTLIRDTSLICENDMPFVPMEQFMQNLDEGKGQSIKTVPVSPYSLNWIPRRSNVSELEKNYVPKPAVKTTLARNKKQRTLPLMYTPDYDEVVIFYCFQLRTCFLANRELVNAHMNKRVRGCVIEWILKVSNYITPEVDSVFYMSVRLFDFAVISLKLNSKLYQLAAIAAIWISAKYLADIKIEVPKLCSFCEIKFSKQEILSMEKKLLKSTHFCLSMVDPLDFLNYYLKLSNLDEDKVLRYGANFVMECSTMFDLYAYTEPTFLVAASLYLAYRVIKQSNVISINFIWYEKVDLETYANDVLKARVLHAIKHQREPAQIYSSAKKLFVAKHFV